MHVAFWITQYTWKLLKDLIPTFISFLHVFLSRLPGLSTACPKCWLALGAAANTCAFKGFQHKCSSSRNLLSWVKQRKFFVYILEGAASQVQTYNYSSLRIRSLVLPLELATLTTVAGWRSRDCCQSEGLKVGHAPQSSSFFLTKSSLGCCTFLTWFQKSSEVYSASFC